MLDRATLGATTWRTITIGRRLGCDAVRYRTQMKKIALLLITVAAAACSKGNAAHAAARTPGCAPDDSARSRVLREGAGRLRPMNGTTLVFHETGTSTVSLALHKASSRGKRLFDNLMKDQDGATPRKPAQAASRSRAARRRGTGPCRSAAGDQADDLGARIRHALEDGQDRDLRGRIRLNKNGVVVERDNLDVCASLR